MKLNSHLGCAQKCQKCKFAPRLLSMIVGISPSERDIDVNMKKFKRFLMFSKGNGRQRDDEMTMSFIQDDEIKIL